MTNPISAARARWRRRGDDGQQAILIVIGVTIIMFGLSTVLVSESTQELPIVDHTLVDHAAYRALQAGVNDYLYAINQNPNAVTCTSASAPGCTFFTSQGFTFGQFNPITNTPQQQTGTSYTPSEWFAVGYPVINQSAGTIEVAVVGAAGFANATSSIQYQTANITFRPANTFLLNVAWSQYNAIDPTIPVSSGCTPTGYLWGGGGSNCGLGDAGTITPSFPYYGPVFSDDEVLVCNQGSTYPTIDHITTAAPNLSYAASGGCSSTVNYLNPSENLSINPNPQSPPTNINTLKTPSTSQGCYYIGPTTIQFLASGGYYVNSPDTPWTSGSTHDGGSIANNKSQCLPSTVNATSGNVTGPYNGVIYVDSLPGASCTSGKPANPLAAAYDANGFTYDGEGTSSKCNGDAIVGGTVNGAYTLAAANDVMIDRNIVYDHCYQLTTADQATMNGTSPLSPWPSSPASKQCATISTSTVNDTLGLIANNFVSINNPLVSSRGGTTLAPACAAGDLTTTDCSNANPIIMASMLALGHTFSVPNFCSSPGVLGNIDMWGSLGEKYIDVEECSGRSTNGYGFDYNWDKRLSILSPPQFFTPSTPAWVTQAFSVTVGQCSTVWPINQSTCPTAP
jgi:hypothetical protein